MIGGGSIQNMLNSLKTNKNMLSERKGFFKKRFNYAELRKYYKESTTAIGGKEASPEDLEKIRISLRKKIKNDKRRSIILTSFITLAVAFGLTYVFNIKSIEKVRHGSKKATKVEMEVIDLYHKNMKLGLKKYKKKDWFFAVGNFKEALRINPNDTIAEYYLTKSYCLACKYKNQTCDFANEWINAMETKYPNSKRYPFLKKKYLEKL